jgi:hypothetical protein
LIGSVDLVERPRRSARLHKLDPEVYLRDVFRVLPHWPRSRHLELAPRYWRITRARLDRKELDREVGWLTLPELPPPIPVLEPHLGDDADGYRQDGESRNAHSSVLLSSIKCGKWAFNWEMCCSPSEPADRFGHLASVDRIA